MSSNIWTRCGASSNLRPLLCQPWRAVDDQAVLSARKLVDSLRQQEVLEQLIESSEQAAVPSAKPEGLHPLLSAPFRRPPLAHGSRFGGRHQRNLWYGSESERTAFAEVAYYRLLFLAGTAAQMPPILTEISTFRISVHTDRGVDLTGPPFDEWHAVLASKTDYAATQSLGSAMRQDRVKAFRYRSARDVEGGVHCGLFTPRAFAAKEPGHFRAWICVATLSGVEVSLRDHLESRSYEFPRGDFEVDGRLPAPAI